MDRDSVPLGADPRQVDGAMRARLGEISAASQLLLRSAREEDKRYLAMILRAAFRAARLVHEGELARRLSGQDEPREQPALVDLVSWCRESVKRAAGLLEQAGIQLRISCEEVSILTVADQELLDEVLYTLLSNAAGAMERGGRIDVGLSRRDSNAVLTVSDEGEGISEEAVARLLREGPMDPDLTPGAGAGLGLRIARAIVEDHGGLLMLKMGKGTGTLCAVSLPIREEAQPRLRSPRMEDGTERALTALSDVLPPECFLPN